MTSLLPRLVADGKTRAALSDSGLMSCAVVAREELQLALAHPELRARRLPLLVLANKSDAPQALSAAHVAAGTSRFF